MDSLTSKTLCLTPKLGLYVVWFKSYSLKRDLAAILAAILNFENAKRG